MMKRYYIIYANFQMIVNIVICILRGNDDDDNHYYCYYRHDTHKNKHIAILSFRLLKLFIYLSNTMCPLLYDTIRYIRWEGI